MPPKRKSAEANLENKLPQVAADLLQPKSVINDTKRAKTTQNAPLGDISNSPCPIKWTAFGTGKYVEDPLRPVAPIQFPVGEEKTEEEDKAKELAQETVEDTVEETPEEIVAPVEAPAKKTTKKTAAKKTATKKATPKSKANVEEPTPVETVAAPEPTPAEPELVPEKTAAPAKRGRKPAAKKAAPKGASKAADTTPVEPVVALEEPVVETAAPTKTKAAAKKPTPKSKSKATDPALVEAKPVPEEPVVEAAANTTKAKKPAAKKATSKAKAKAAEPALVIEPAPVAEPAKLAKRPTKSKEPMAIEEPEAPTPAPTKKSTKAAKATKEPKALKEPAPKASKLAKGALPTFITTVTLEGEEDDSVPVFDTCDVIRRKITGALTSSGHTKASLLRAFAACTSEPDRPIAPNSFQRFMAAKGKTGGCTNRTFYAAYVYFEKQRIAEKKKKTKTREEMEAAWGVDGMDYENLGRPMAWIIPAHESLGIDQYGRMTLSSRGGQAMILT
ncbi:uncharacterized protein DFL_001310 [Arthrobotrys flagrans]|uniref:DUF7726 domain-containing protein n=1 Tax=Arthrobotrys flagrans TaxID=97331 RepID=A0A437AGZ8_ARTFL|nr:hypothetical protein DFL_001310 [Arthrobotrys flagrans]